VVILTHLASPYEATSLSMYHFHLLLVALMDDDRRRVLVRTVFHPLHRMYLWTCNLQWAACMLLVWWMIRAWRDEDRAVEGQ
jgi:hypothetical protein